jgi:hypothetical protein
VDGVAIVCGFSVVGVGAAAGVPPKENEGMDASDGAGTVAGAAAGVLPKESAGLDASVGAGVAAGADTKVFPNETVGLAVSVGAAVGALDATGAGLGASFWRLRFISFQMRCSRSSLSC